MSADMALQWWVLLLALIPLVGFAIGQKPILRPVVIGGLIAALLIHRVLRWRRRNRNLPRKL
jgi:hypothetical protein